MKLLSLFVFLLPLSAFGADLVESINHATQSLNGPEVAMGIATFGAIVEAFLRFIPSQKALGGLLFLAALFHAIAGFFEALDQAFEKLVPQNLKEKK